MRKTSTRNNQSSTGTQFTFEELFDVHHGDARALSKCLPDKCIDVTVTSPPYFDMKDYGVKNQIGFGQDYETYLNDLQKIFSEVFRATKDSGSLWIVIDSFRSNQEVVPLPFDLAARLRTAGWILRDIIIWKKERTLPWSHKGTTRKIFEYIMLFAKSSKNFQYYPDRHRDTSDLKRWWVRYPERYNPKGKSLEEIWCYDIPTQGSWGKSYVQHFCPLPSQLVSRIISLTSNPDDVVLDPFSGSGTVPAEAALLNRKYVGFELNRRYISMFRKHLQKQQMHRQNPSTNISPETAINNFEQTIFDLRALKFARLLCRALEKELEGNSPQLFVQHSRTKATLPNKLISVEFIVYGIQPKSIKAARELLATLCLKAPLSKFGIEQKISFIGKLEELPNTFQTKKLYLYSKTNSHQYANTCKWKDLPNIKHPLISTIAASVEEPDD